MTLTSKISIQDTILPVISLLTASMSARMASLPNTGSPPVAAAKADPLWD